MTPKNIAQVSEPNVTIRHGRVNSIDLFEVKENELETLEKGDQADIYLNFAIFLISIAVSSIGALTTADFKKPIYQTLFIVILVVGIVLGGLLLILWNRNRKGVKEIIKQIRQRIPPEILHAEQETAIELIEESSTITLETTRPQG